MEQFLWLIPLGFLVGAFGTLIGAGGGFILVPVLLLLYPDKSPETITTISLAVVLINSISGSISYGKMKKIDYKSGFIFTLATLPGSIIGAYVTSLISRNIFNIIFSTLLIAGSIFLLLKPEKSKNASTKAQPKKFLARTITDIEGNTYSFSYNPVVGIVISIFVGFLSSLLGIGGGIIHVPVLIHVLNFPVHIATATSQFVLIGMSLSGTIVHALSGELFKGILQTIGLSIGVIFGSRVGAKLSKRLNGSIIIRGLAIALGVVGIRILLGELL